MIKKSVLIGISVVFLGFNITLVYKLYQSKSTLSSLEMVSDRSRDSNELIKKLKDSILFSFIREGRVFPANMVVKDRFGKDNNLGSIVNSDKCLFFRITSNSCDMCIENQLGLLKKYFPNDANNIYILVTMDYELFKLKYSDFFLNDQIYLVPIELEKELDDINFPYYFFYNNGKMENNFYPHREFPELTHSYIKMIKEKLNSEAP